MSTIVTRASKGLPLSHGEMDANLTNLNTDKLEASALVGLITASSTDTLTNKTVTNGVFDADDVTFSSVTGSAVSQIVIYKDTGTASNSPLIAYFDSPTSGLPITPNGGNITIAWSNDSSKIFKL